MTVFLLPNATTLPIGFCARIEVKEGEDVEVYTYDTFVKVNKYPLIRLHSPGPYEFYLCENKTPQGYWVSPYLENMQDFLKPSGNGVDVADMVNHPPHYTSSKAYCANCKESIECIEIARHMSFNIGNAVKYLWRHELKGGLEDLKKAKWYINDAIKQLED